MSKDRQQPNRILLPLNEADPIVVPAARAEWTYGDHLRHLAGHAGTIPLTLDEFGRCVVCMRLGWFRPNA